MYGALCLGIRCWGFPGEYLSDCWCAGALFLGERSCFRGFYDIFLSLFVCNLQSHFLNKLNLIIKLRFVFVIFVYCMGFMLDCPSFLTLPTHFSTLLPFVYFFVISVYLNINFIDSYRVKYI